MMKNNRGGREWEEMREGGRGKRRGREREKTRKGEGSDEGGRGK